MTKTKKILIGIFTPIIVCILAFVGAVSGILITRHFKVNQNDFSALSGAATKTVLFIGDGMGENHIKATGAYYEKDMFVQSFAIKGEISTFSTKLFRPTDSAAAGSALSTGKKYNNGEIARHDGKDIETLGEYAKGLGLGVAIVTTDSLSGATPASFSAHASYRKHSDDIIKSQLKSNIDLFVGAGYSQYMGYQSNINDSGYALLNDLSLEATSQKLIYAFDDIVPENGTSSAPSLDIMTEFALDYMEANFPNGYFVMIEGAHIDKRSHNNDIMGMVKWLNNFDKSIEIAHSKLSVLNNTAIVVTADHETGGLNYKNQSKDKINNSLFSRPGHSSRNVPYYVYLNTEKEIDKKSVFKKTLDNTDISKIVRSLITAK